jgi:predicted ATPase with chaperone activity
MIGPPGFGKSMIEKRVPAIMREPDFDEFLDVLRIHSAAWRTLNGELPFLNRSFAHHTTR